MRPRASRTLIMAALGAIVGLLIAGTGLFTARGTRVAGVPAEDVAVVNEVPILRSDYITQLRALFDVSFAEATPAQRRQVLNDMVREELYVQRGLELGMPTDDIEVRRALFTATEGQSVVDATTALPSETELRAYFSRTRAQFANEGSIAVEDWICPPGSDPQGLAAAVQRGIPPTSLGLQRSAQDPSLQFYWAARLHLGNALFSAARDLRRGTATSATARTGEHHVLRVLQNIAPIPARFDDVRSEVLTHYRDAAAARIKSATDGFLRRRADIRVTPELE